MIQIAILFLILSSVLARNCLLPGERLKIGESLTSENGLYSLRLINQGNVCVYDTAKRWCSGWVSPSASQMNLTNIGKFGVIKTNGICVWAPHNPITTMLPNVRYIIIGNNANLLVYNSSGLAWSCKRGTFTYPAGVACPIVGTNEETDELCNGQTRTPSFRPTLSPSIYPTFLPSLFPSLIPSVEPSLLPSVEPSILPSVEPTFFPTISPTFEPSISPSVEATPLPSVEPSISPTFIPTLLPTFRSTLSPTFRPTLSPTRIPTLVPTRPTQIPTVSPTKIPTLSPTVNPTKSPFIPTNEIGNAYDFFNVKEIFNVFDDYSDEGLIIAKSKIHGLGVFTTKPIRQGKIITYYPPHYLIYVVDDNHEILYSNLTNDKTITDQIIENYSFTISPEIQLFGDPEILDSYLGHMINDGYNFIDSELENYNEDNNNAIFFVSYDTNKVYIFANRDIDKGEEITISYGAEFWFSKNFD